MCTSNLRWKVKVNYGCEHWHEEFGVGLATEFHSEKIPRNRIGMASVIPRKKVLIPRHSEIYVRDYSVAPNGRKCHE